MLTEEILRYIAPIAQAIYLAQGIEEIRPTGEVEHPVFVLLSDGSLIEPTYDEIIQAWQSMPESSAVDTNSA